MQCKHKIGILIQSGLLGLMLAGCVHNVPLKVDPSRDMARAFPMMNKIQAKVGLYISDDLKNYTYKQQKMGMTFQMKAGEYLPPIAMQMAKAMFEEVVLVNSLPPYNEGYKPDVEAVAVPEILYCYGNAVGTLSGYIEGKVLIRLVGYDLGGKVIWRNEAQGENRSKRLDFASAFLGGMEEVGKTGYSAAFTAAIKIINSFNANPPNELSDLLEIKNLKKLKNLKNISNFDLFEKYYQKGRTQYKNKNYYQALYSFEKAEQLNSNDLSTLFYIGTCYTHTAEKNKAIEKFNKIVRLNSTSQEAQESIKWIKLLKSPLKIAIINYFRQDDYIKSVVTIDKILASSQLYELTDVNDLMLLTKSKPPGEWDQFFARCYERGIKIVIVNAIQIVSEKLRGNQNEDGDFATDHMLKLWTKAFLAKKKEFKAEIKIEERTSTINKISMEEEFFIKKQLLKKGAEKLLLRLLENDIY